MKILKNLLCQSCVCTHKYLKQKTKKHEQNHAYCERKKKKKKTQAKRWVLPHQIE